MYRSTKFLEVLHAIRKEMSEEFDYEVLKLTEALTVAADAPAETPAAPEAAKNFPQTATKR